ncbi:hypothetical protein NXV57_27390 [Bacteroides thetaiotaomicron]|nr:hypothetical protein [Bacteroides thetaiotaomicron]
MDYDELVQKNIAGEISDLEFLLAQEEPCTSLSRRDGCQAARDKQPNGQRMAA